MQNMESYEGFGDEPVIISGGQPILLREVEEGYKDRKKGKGDE